MPTFRAGGFKSILYSEKTCSRSLESVFFGSILSGESMSEPSELDLAMLVDFWWCFVMVTSTFYRDQLGFFLRTWIAGFTAVIISCWLPGSWSLLMVAPFMGKFGFSSDLQYSSSVRSRPQTLLSRCCFGTLSSKILTPELLFPWLGLRSGESYMLTTGGGYNLQAVLFMEMAVATLKSLSKCISWKATCRVGTSCFCDFVTHTFAVIDGFFSSGNDVSSKLFLSKTGIWTNLGPCSTKPDFMLSVTVALNSSLVSFIRNWVVGGSSCLSDETVYRGGG